MPPEKRTEVLFTIGTAIALMVVTVALIFAGAFDDPRGPQMGAIEVYETLCWSLAMLCVGHGSYRTVRKWSSDRKELGPDA